MTRFRGHTFRDDTVVFFPSLLLNRRKYSSIFLCAPFFARQTGPSIGVMECVSVGGEKHRGWGCASGGHSHADPT
jgi:hypothetical protein